MSGGLFGIGVSGLRASQVALSTTGNNIANANTPGYTRQRAEQVTQPGTATGAGVVGSGTRVETVARITSEYRVAQLRRETSLSSELSSYLEQVSEIDRLLADESTGLAPALDRFFGAVQTAADDPASLPARELVIASAAGLAERFGALDRRLGDQVANVNGALGANVAEIGTLARDVADLNVRIARASGPGRSPNELLDQRDERIRALAELVNVEIVEQDGFVNVFVGNGQGLVVGAEVTPLALAPTADPDRPALRLGTGQGALDVTRELTGGSVGGLVQFREELALRVRSGLGELAGVLTEAVNDLHRQGVTLRGEAGGDLFRDLNDPALARARVLEVSRGPGSDAVPELYLRDASALSGSDYEVAATGPGADQVEIRRVRDGSVVYAGVLTAAQPARFDGLELSLAAGGLEAGDVLRLQATRGLASDFDVAVADPLDLALAKPVRAEARRGNTGTGVLETVGVLGTDGPWFGDDNVPVPPILVRFTAEDRYDLLDYSDPANPVPLDPPRLGQPFAPGASNALFPTEPGTTLVTATGRKAGGLAAGPTLQTDVAESLNTITPETVTVLRRDDAGAVTERREVTFEAGSSARELAARLSSLTGVAASADTRVELTELVDDGSATPLRVFVNGIPIEADPTRPGARLDGDRIAEVVAEDPRFATAGLEVRATAEGVRLRSLTGDDIQIAVEGDPGEGLTVLAPARRERLRLEGVGAPPAPRFVGTATVDGGVDLTTAGPHRIGVALPDGRSATVTLSGAYGDGAAVEAALRDGLAAEGLGPGDLLVGRDDTGALVLTGAAGGSDATLTLSGTAAALSALGLAAGTARGEDLARGVAVTGVVSATLGPGLELEAEPAQVAGGYFTRPVARAPAYLGLDVRLAGNPDPGDEFVIGANEDGTSDNRNAIAIADLELAPLVSGRGTLTDGYGELVETVGTTTARYRVNAEAAETLRDAAEADLAAVAGVNLDEEAANLVRFQQAFQASARIIRTAQEVFDTLISSFG